MRMRFLAVTALIPLLAVACGSNSGSGQPQGGGQGPDSVTLTLNWYPYGEHAPFYYGVKQGIYTKHGIDLKIVSGQGSGKTVQAVGGDQTDFGWADTAAFATAVGQGVPVKNLGVFLQTTPASVQFFGSQNITKPADLKGKKIAGTAGDALSKTFPAFLKQNGLAETDVVLQNTDPAGKIAAVMSGQADALLGNATDQGPTMQDKSGKQVSYLRFADFGLNFYSNGLLISKKKLAAEPDLAKRMAAATSEAWAAAEKAPQAAVDAMAGASEQLPPTTVLLEQFKATITLMHTPATTSLPPGVNTAADWQATLDVFIKAGIIPKAEAPATYWDESVGPKG